MLLTHRKFEFTFWSSGVRRLLFFILTTILSGSPTATGTTQPTCPIILDRATQLRHLYRIYSDLAASGVVGEDDVLSTMGRAIDHGALAGRAVAAFGSGWWDIVDLIASLPTASEYHLFDIIDYSIKGGAPAILAKVQEALSAAGASHIDVRDRGFLSIIGRDEKPKGWFEDNLPTLASLHRPFVLTYKMRDPWGALRDQKLYFHVVNLRDPTQVKRILASIDPKIGWGAFLWNSGTMISSVSSVTQLMVSELRRSNGVLILHPEIGSKTIAKGDWFGPKDTLKPKSILIDQEAADPTSSYGRRRYSIGLNRWLRAAEAGAHTIKVGDQFTVGVSQRIVPVVITFK